MSFINTIQKMIHTVREYVDYDYITEQFRAELQAEFPDLTDREIRKIVS